jgi:hypothetical protein
MSRFVERKLVMCSPRENHDGKREAQDAVNGEHPLGIRDPSLSYVFQFKPSETRQRLRTQLDSARRDIGCFIYDIAISSGQFWSRSLRQAAAQTRDDCGAADSTEELAFRMAAAALSALGEPQFSFSAVRIGWWRHSGRNYFLIGHFLNLAMKPARDIVLPQ